MIKFKKQPVFTQQDIEEWKNTHLAFNKINQKVINRVNHVINIICKAFNFDYKEIVSYWHFYGAGEGEIGNFDLNSFLLYKEVTYGFAYTQKATLANKTIDNDFWGYSDGFPSSFLTMTDDEIIAHIQDENKRTEQKKEEQAKKEKASNNKKKQIIKKAKAKLTAAERKALGIK